MRANLPRKIAELTLDLGLDVERLAAPGDAAGVAGPHQRPDLLDDLRIARRARAGERGQLRFDVLRRLAAGATAGVAGLEHLADLSVSFGSAHGGCGRAATAAGAHVAVLADREPTVADVVVEPPAGEQRDDRDHGPNT